MHAKAAGSFPPTVTNRSAVESATRRTVAIVLAGGKGTRLGALTRRECKPALPFAGSRRTIDFSLSNCVNSGIHRIAVATQHMDRSLVQHVSQVWRYRGGAQDRFVALWRAAQRAPLTGYAGTADAVYRNWDTIEALDPQLVIVLAGDHVYKMDYRPMIRHHLENGADATVACVEVPVAQAHEFGVMSVDRRSRIVRFSEKPVHPESIPGHPELALASMGVYVFNASFLGQVLLDDAQSKTSSHDFGRDLIPQLSNDANVFAYPFAEDAGVGRGYWRDVGTVPAYWQAHMDILDGKVGIQLEDTTWPIWSGIQVVRLGQRHNVFDSLLAHSCEVNQVAAVRRSVLFRGVTVEHGTTLSNAVILPDARVGRHCYLSNVVVDSGVLIPDDTVIGPSYSPDHTTVSVEPVLVTADMIAAARNGEREHPDSPGPGTTHDFGQTQTGAARCAGPDKIINRSVK